jgi:hypothetical protein
LSVLLTARESRQTGRPGRQAPLDRAKRAGSAGPDPRGPAQRGRTLGFSIDWRGGQLHVRRHERKLSEVTARAGVITRAVTGCYSGPHGTGRTRRTPQDPVTGITEPSWPARHSLPRLEPRRSRPALESDGWTSPGVTRRWRRDSEVSSKRKRNPRRRGVTCRNKTRTPPERRARCRPIMARQCIRFTTLQFFLSRTKQGSSSRHHHTFRQGDCYSPVASCFCPPARHVGKWWCVTDRLQPVTGFSRATHAWDRLSAGTPARAVTAVTAVTAP